MPNHLAHETSPYLLQHKDNPVDWYPWGPEARARAKAENKPIFLSIGYAACHWCHVMAHESFENSEVAALLNEKFVNIKVDREERPDLDQIYMNAVQLMTGQGGWPMSVFLTPDLQPFFGGTYWPRERKYQMPGFGEILRAVDEAWKNRRELALEQASQLTEHLRDVALLPAATTGLRPELLSHAVAKLGHDFDTAHGGFGYKPKFPHASALQFMLRMCRRTGRRGRPGTSSESHPAGSRTAADGKVPGPLFSGGVLELVQLNLDKMAQGGIYDHLGGGFARYSVDERWLVPHFEKMLYDNGLLAGAYLDGYLATGRGEYARVVRETLDYALNYLADPAGGFHSSEDADSEGEEGKFYVWTPAEIKQVLGQEKGARFCYVYDVTEAGNFEGHSILNLPKTIEQCAALRRWDVGELHTELTDSRRQLLTVRDRRPRPGKDDKVLVNWNALLIDALARAAGALDQPQYLTAAIRCAEFLFRDVRRADGRLLHCWRRGQARYDAYLDDYTFLIDALVTLYEASFEERWIGEAVRLADIVLKHFADDAAGGFYFTADDHEQLLTRTKDLYESSIPSGNAMAATALLRLGRLTGREDYLEQARRTLELSSGLLEQTPAAAAQMLLAATMFVGPLREIVMLGDLHSPDTAAVLSDLRKRFVPDCVVACRRPDHTGGSSALDPLFVGKQPRSPAPTVFVCENFACQAPVSGVTAVLDAWKRLAAGGLAVPTN